MNLLGRALFFRTGLREQVREEIERQQQREREVTQKLEDHLDKAHLEERVAVLERARQGDQEERVRALVAEMEAQLPLPSIAAHAQQAIGRLHGADTPADAQPPALERYTYQFYIGKPHGRQG